MIKKADMTQKADITQLIKEYSRINTSTIGHITDKGYLPDIKAVHATGDSHAGKIVTVTLLSDNTEVIRQALIEAQMGEVLFIDARLLNERACWGALRTCAAIYERLTAVVVLGKVTDSVELKQLGFPVFALGVSSLTTFNSDGAQGVLHVEVDYQHEHHQTQVRSGDIAILDDDGVFVLSVEIAELILSECQQKQTQDEEKFKLFMQAYKNDQLDRLLIK